MQTYSALATQHIEAANLTPRELRKLERKGVKPEKMHALAFGVIESAGLGIMDMTEADVVKAVYAEVKMAGVVGWLINGLIMQVVTRLVAAAWAWLIAKIDEWRERQRKMGTGAPHMAAMGLRSELEPLFADARKVVGR